VIAGQGTECFGSVGTGFTTKTATELKRQLKTLEIPKPEIPIKAKCTVWMTPALPAEIAFRGWTNDDNLRHASYKGLREEADMADVFELNPA